MGEEFNLLIKYCATRTVPAAETKSIGLQADLPTGRQALWCLASLPAGRFFARRLDYFIMTRQLSPIYRDLLPFRSFIVTRHLSTVYRVPIAIGRQKTRHRDADGN